jgi:ubiquinone/menaquinone biosynthesis C-methylase UbiE
MAPERAGEHEQTARWRGHSGNAWVDLQPVLDAMYKPLEDLLVAAVAADRTDVLDVGCGTGGTTVAVARRLGAAARCVGVDISDPMVAAARERAEREGVRVRFIHANAQDHAFAPATFDAIISRFGVMFFDDSVQAFANLRRAAKRDAELRFIAWRSAAENPFMTTAERAAAPLLPTVPARRPDGPGQFAFADAERVQQILEESGWADVDVRPVDATCAMPERELVGFFTRLGPVGQALPDADEATRARVVEAVRAAFDPYVDGSEARYTAACWMVGARAGG